MPLDELQRRTGIIYVAPPHPILPGTTIKLLDGDKVRVLIAHPDSPAEKWLFQSGKWIEEPLDAA